MTIEQVLKQRKEEAEKINREIIKQLFDTYPEIKKKYDKVCYFNTLLIGKSLGTITSEDTEEIDDVETLSEIANREYENELKKYNITLEDLKTKYHCNECNDTGFKNQKKCKCRKKLEILKNIQENDLQGFKNLSLKDFKTDVQKEPHLSRLDKIKGIVQGFIKSFNDKEQKSLLFSGDTGLGKTYLSKLIVIELISKGKIVKYVKAPEMFNSLSFYKLNDMERYVNDLNELKNTELLVIDDLGTEKLSESKEQDLYDIIDFRIEKNKKTIISTNLDLNLIAETYSKRICSRFKGHYEMLLFTGQDLRERM